MTLLTPAEIVELAGSLHAIEPRHLEQVALSLLALDDHQFTNAVHLLTSQENPVGSKNSRLLCQFYPAANGSNGPVAQRMVRMTLKGRH